MDVKRHHADILAHLLINPIAKAHLLDSSNPQWTTNEAGYLRLNGHIYIPKANDLCLCVLKYKHDHPLSGHFGQNHTLELIRCKYTWPGIRTYMKDYIKSCMACAQAKTSCHWPYGMLKQLLVPDQPWNSISMDFIEQLLPPLASPPY